MECWAAEIGGCAGKVSREHLVTDGIWTGPDIQVVGLPWCRTVPVSVGRASIVSKILCRTHNSALSEVDSAAIRTFRTLREAAELQERRRRAFFPPVVPHCFEVDGALLERWFLKTAINLALVQQGQVSWYDGKFGRVPPRVLVEAAFGGPPLAAGAGLYAAASVGETGFANESVQFAPLFDVNDALPGAIFSFCGFRFLLSLREGPLPRKISIGADESSPWFATDLLHHIQRLRFTLADSISHWVYFEWPEKQSAHFGE